MYLISVCSEEMLSRIIRLDSALVPVKLNYYLIIFDINLNSKRNLLVLKVFFFQKTHFGLVGALKCLRKVFKLL
jgi:hypothetical protein